MRKTRRGVYGQEDYVKTKTRDHPTHRGGKNRCQQREGPKTPMREGKCRKIAGVAGNAWFGEAGIREKWWGAAREWVGRLR